MTVGECAPHTFGAVLETDGVGRAMRFATETDELHFAPQDLPLRKKVAQLPGRGSVSPAPG